MSELGRTTKTEMLRRDRVLSYVRRYGRQATSFQVLEQGYEYWFGGCGLDACVAYRRTGHTRVVAGSPLVADEVLVHAVQRFCADAARHGERVVWFGVDDHFVQRMRTQLPAFDALAVGREPVWDLESPDVVPSRSHLRTQARRARRKQVRVERVESGVVAGGQSLLRREMESLIERWYATRSMPPMRFLVNVDPFGLADERRYYTARSHGKLVGLLVAAPIYGARGWLFENLVRDPAAPNGTVELLIEAALIEAQQRGDRRVSMGLSPLADVSPGPGRHRWLRRGLALCYRHLEPMYRFRGLHAFKARMRPQRWERQYIAVSAGRVSAASFLAVLRAFAGTNLRRYAFDLVVRRVGVLQAQIVRRIGLTVARGPEALPPGARWEKVR